MDALWLSPIYPSPGADMGYDVSDYTGVDPAYGTLDDFDALLAAAHERGLKLLMDLVPCHTSIEHPWFREHPDWYIWSGREGPANNWVAAFGGSAWSPDPQGRGGWYLHSFYPEQPDLDWRNPEVVAAMQDVLRFWLDRGVDGFRLDAIDRLVKDAELRDDPPASAPFALPLGEEYARLEHLYSANSPDIREALGAIREAAGDRLLVGEVYLPPREVTPYLEHLDLAFAFELFHSPWERDRLQAAIAGRAERSVGGDRVGALQPRLPAAARPLRRGERARGGRGAAAHAPGHRVRLPGRRDRHGRRTGRRRRSTAPAATARATRCSGTAPTAASRPASRGCRWSTRRSATSPTSATTPTRCSRWCA